MTNSYFNYTDPVSPGDRIESAKYNGDFAAVERAFDVLPSPDALATNTGNYAESTGSATAYAARLPNFDGSFGYLMGMQVILKVHINNTGAATLNVNGLGPKPLVNLITGLGPLEANDLRAGTIYSIRYDGTRFQVVNTVSNAIAATQTAATAASNSATAASNSATAASNSATAAASSASTASTAATSASNSATSAANSASAASASATAAAGSATSASDSADTATSAAGAASASATAASGSATAAASSATAASGSASAAASSASAAASSASAAASSASAAAAVLTSPAFKNAVLEVLKTTSLRVNVVKLYAANIDPNTMYPGTVWERLPENAMIRTANSTGSDVMTTGGSDTISLSAANLPSHSHTGSVSVGAFDYGTKSTSAFDYGTKTSSAYNYGTVTTSSYDYGTKSTSSYDFPAVSTSSAGAHTHSVTTRSSGDYGTAALAGRTAAGSSNNYYTSNAGAHTHTINLGSHSHSVGIGAHSHTINLGSHSHAVAIGSHTHTVGIGSHTHTVSVSIASAGQGTSFSVVNKFVKLVAWRRVS